MPALRLRWLVVCALLAACTDGATPDCSSDASGCGYDQPPPLQPLDAGAG